MSLMVLCTRKIVTALFKWSKKRKWFLEPCSQCRLSQTERQEHCFSFVPSLHAVGYL